MVQTIVRTAAHISDIDICRADAQRFKFQYDLTRIRNKRFVIKMNVGNFDDTFFFIGNRHIVNRVLGYKHRGVQCIMMTDNDRINNRKYNCRDHNDQ